MFILNPYIFAPTSTLNNGLISVYKAESNELDSYGTNNGSPFGGLLYITGKQGNGFRFNGSNSYVQLPNDAFSIQDFSISLWFNPASYVIDRTIFSNSNGDGINVGTGYWLGMSPSGVLDFFIYGGTSSLVATHYRYNSLTVNTWYNITLTKTQNNQAIMYVNGSIVTPTITNYGGGTINPVYSFGSYTYSTPCIGAYVYNNTSSKGLYGSSTTDEIGIWNRALTPIEVTELYGCGIGKFYPFITAPTIDSDACAFITAASITDNIQVNAINQLVLDLKSANIWTKMKAIYPFVGGNAESHRWNLKNTLQYKIDWSGGMSHNSNGIIPNGTTSFGNTNLNAFIDLVNSNIHVSFYSRTADTANSYSLEILPDSTYNANNYLSLRTNNKTPGDVYFSAGSDSAGATVSQTNSGFFIGSETSSNLRKIYRNGSVIATNNTSDSNNLPNSNICILGSNIANFYSLNNGAFSSFGEGLSDSEAVAFYNAVQTFQIALGDGRAV